MKEIFEKMTDEFVPEAMLVIYSNKENDKYLECHRIASDGTVGEAHPVSHNFISNLISSFSEDFKSMPHGVIPDNMILADTRAGHEHYVWWNKPRKRHMYFVKDLGLDDGEYNMPAVIYEVKDKRLKVFAFKYMNHKPNEKTKLLKGPFFNYYSNGAICLGNSKAKININPSWEQLQIYWEALFWQSINSHTIDSSTSKPLIPLIKDAKDKPFDISACLPFGFTLKKILKDD